MRSASFKAACGAAIAAMLAVASGFAAPPKEIAIGAKAPDFKLLGVDGKYYSLSDALKKNKVVVVVFTCNHCPVAKAYEDRLVALQKDYKDKGVLILAINSNDPNYPGEGMENMKKRAKEKKFNFPYIIDETQKIARAYGARVTPHIFVVGKDGKIAYRGAIDDSKNPRRVKKRYLRDAIDALLAGKAVPVSSTKAFGCTIKWKKK